MEQRAFSLPLDGTNASVEQIQYFFRHKGQIIIYKNVVQLFTLYALPSKAWFSIKTLKAFVKTDSSMF